MSILDSARQHGLTDRQVAVLRDGYKVMDDAAEHLINEKNLYHAIKRLVDVINQAGVHNLSNGVQLGQTVWSVKCNDAMDEAKLVLSAVDKEEGKND